jgi:hypothetical protein
MKIRYGNDETDIDVEIIGEGQQTLSVNVGDTPYRVEIRYGPALEEAAYRDKKWLAAEYIKGRRSMQSIATQCGVSPMTIWLWLDKHDIPKRGRGRNKNQ